MNLKIFSIISLVALASLLSACSDDSSQKDDNQSQATSEDDIGILEPYLDDPVLETHKNGERKIGLYSESNGQGKLQDCKTGKEYSIDIHEDSSLLHPTYLSLISNEEQKLMVELIAEIKSGKDDSDRLHTQKLLSIIHLSSCPQPSS